MHILIGLAVALALSGGVVVAAGNAQEGDTLYTVKTHVNEPVGSTVRGFFDKEAATDAEAEAEANATTSAEAELESATGADVQLDAGLDASLDTEGGALLDIGR